MHQEHQKHHHEHEHEHHHDNNHKHSHNAMYIGYLIGLLIYIAMFFVNNENLDLYAYSAVILFSGYHIALEGITDTIKDSKENKKFSPNIHILMILAAIGSIWIQYAEEGALLILVFAGAHFLEHYVENKSKREISNLLKLNPVEARLVKADNQVEMVHVDTLKVGDVIRILNGDQVPADGKILQGQTFIDESSINGESLPKEKSVDDLVYASTMNHTNTIDVVVLKENKDSIFSGIVKMVSTIKQNKSKTEIKIKKLEPVYVKIVLVIVPLFILLGKFAFAWSWQYSFYRGMVLLTVASPCAIAAVVAPATLSALSNLTKIGILFKGGAYLSIFSEIKAIAFDKTGTLTKGVLSVTDTYFIKDEAYYKQLIVSMETQSNHPLANAVIRHFKDQELLTLEVENVIGKGLITTYKNHEYQLGKKRPDTLLKEDMRLKIEKLEEEGKTVIYLYENQTLVSFLALLDEPLEEAKEMIAYFKKQGIYTIMVTGDTKKTGEAIGKLLGIDEVIGGVMPNQKVEVITALQDKYGSVAMVGDGVNDAPALTKANLGIAMGDGTSIAIEVSDAVMMNQQITKIAYAHQKSLKLHRIIIQNFVFAMLIVVALVVMNLLEMMNLPIGVIVHEGSTLFVIFNGLRLLRKERLSC